MARKQEKIDFSKMKKVKKISSYKDDTFHFYLSFKGRLISYFLIIILLGVSAYYFINKGVATDDVITLSYNENGNVKYDVEFLDNDYYRDGNMPEGFVYIPSLINKINTKFMYNYYISDNMKINYDYKIVAEVTINNSNDDILYRKEDIIFESDEMSGKSNKININKLVEVDYKYYHDLVANYIAQYGVGSSATLKVKMEVQNIGEYDLFANELIKKNDFSLTIPLMGNEAKITLNNGEYLNEGNYEELVKTGSINELSLYIGLIFFVLDILFIIYFITFIYKISPKRTKYCKLRDGILNDYDKVIVNSKKIPVITDETIIDCYSFSELLDAQSTLQKPIIYYEIIRNQKSAFIIVDNGTVYRYILKECDLEY